MKTAISVPNEVFREADRLARRFGTSRSEIYSRALVEYLARHAPDRVTETIDRLWDELGKDDRDFTKAAAARTLRLTDW